MQGRRGDSREEWDDPQGGSTGVGGDDPRTLGELLAELDAVTAAITARFPDELDGHAAAEASLRVHRATDRLRATQLGWLGVVEGAGAWLGTGARSFRVWVARSHGVSFAEAGRWIRPARVWRDDLATTAAAARSGAVSTAQGALIAATANTPRRLDALLSPTEGGRDDGAPANDGSVDDSTPTEGTAGAGATGPTGEEILLELAQGCTVDQLAKLTRRFAHVVDPDADERGYREALEREHFDLAATTGGYHVSGFMTLEHGQLVKTALRAVTGVPAATDTRTAGQRRAAALASLSRLVLDKGLTGTVGTVRPHLSVHVTLTELAHLLHGAVCRADGTHTSSRDARCTAAPVDGGYRIPGFGAGHVFDLTSLVTAPPAEWEDGSGPVPRAVLQRLAADCELTRVIFGPDSQILDVGRTARTFTGHLRRAVIARDRACVVDGCDAPPSIGQIHHAVTRWADGGTTSTDNAALVCAFHNQWLEDHRVPMDWVTDPDGKNGRWRLGKVGSYRPDRPGARRPVHRRPPSVGAARGSGARGSGAKSPPGHRRPVTPDEHPDPDEPPADRS